MSVLKKLMQARIKLQGMELKKSGENKFAGYKYFELGDFLPQTMQIFSDLNLASVVSFSKEDATLSITDCDDGSSVVINSPMADANLKGAHPIQNLGAVESYQRRYLWLSAMEIVEHDIIDASPAVEKKPEAKPLPQKIEGSDGAWKIQVVAKPDGDVQNWLGVVLDACRSALEMVETESDVMALFKKNKQLFDEVKSRDSEFFKDLMGLFTKAKERVK